MEEGWEGEGEGQGWVGGLVGRGMEMFGMALCFNP